MIAAEPSRLFSDQWYRVRDVSPQLAAGAQVTCQHSRGQNWYVISLPGQNRRMRINESAYAVVGRCDGTNSLDAIFRILLKTDPESLPTQQEIIDLLGKLIPDGYMHCNNWPQLDAVIDNQNKRVNQQRRQKINPLSPRISICNPDNWLSQFDGLGRFLFSGAGLILWLVIVTFGLLTLAENWIAISAYARQWAMSPSMLVTAVPVFIIIKLFHETAHGLAVRRWGGRVTDAGIGFLMLFPAPYMDASDANQFPDPARRAWVSAAGIVTELVIAALAICAWRYVEPGFLRDALFGCAAIAGFSTIAFNANPLVRLDGYYVLTDIAHLPNLAQRSRQFWQALLCRHILALPAPGPDHSNGEKSWLIWYQPLSWTYRLSIMIWFSWWAASYSPGLGLIIGSAALIWLVLMPIWRFIQLPSRMGIDLAQSGRGWFRLTNIGLALILFGLLPLPDRGLALGVIWTPEESQVRARHDGFVTNLATAPNASVEQGQTLLLLSDPVVDARVESMRSKMPGLQSAWLSNVNEDAVKARHTQEKIRQAVSEMAYVIESQQQLQVVSPTSGRLRLTQPWTDLRGSFVRKGDLLAYIEKPAQPVVRAVLNQDQAARLRTRMNTSKHPISASIRLPGSSTQTVAARVKQFFPAAVANLPSAALAQVNGGNIAVDIETADQLEPTEPGFVLDVIGTDSVSAAIGSRAWIRLEFGYSTAAMQLARWLRRFLNSDAASQLG